MGDANQQQPLPPEQQKQLKTQAQTCLIVSGAFMEIAGTLRRVRAALTAPPVMLTEAISGWMATTEAEFLRRAIEAETEARGLSETAYALASGAPAASHAGPEGAPEEPKP